MCKNRTRGWDLICLLSYWNLIVYQVFIEYLSGGIASGNMNPHCYPCETFGQWMINTSSAFVNLTALCSLLSNVLLQGTDVLQKALEDVEAKHKVLKEKQR